MVSTSGSLRVVGLLEHVGWLPPEKKFQENQGEDVLSFMTGLQIQALSFLLPSLSYERVLRPAQLKSRGIRLQSGARSRCRRTCGRETVLLPFWEVTVHHGIISG